MQEKSEQCTSSCLTCLQRIRSPLETVVNHWVEPETVRPTVFVKKYANGGDFGGLTPIELLRVYLRVFLADFERSLYFFLTKNMQSEILRM